MRDAVVLFSFRADLVETYRRSTHVLFAKPFERARIGRNEFGVDTKLLSVRATLALRRDHICISDCHFLHIIILLVKVVLSGSYNRGIACATIRRDSLAGLDA